MTEKGSPIAAGGAIREEAATWFARMRGPDAADDRAAFEVWLAQSPLHRDAYSRMAEVFSLGKGLGIRPPGQAPDDAGDVVWPPAARHLLAVACGVVIAGSLGTGTWYWKQRTMIGNGGTAVQRSSATATLALATPVGSIRSWHLPDGSRVTLDTSSALAIDFSATVRTLRLLRGRARFDVSHEARPFVVSAGAGTVTAHGTLFDVRIQAGGGVAVRLIRGAIDVDLPASRRLPTALHQRLSPGEQLVFDTTALPAPRAAAAPPDARWPDATLDCDHATLAAVVAEANRYSATHIVLTGQDLAALQVSGSFRIDQPDRLARRLAMLFDLDVEQDGPARLLLTRPQPMEEFPPQVS